MNRRITAVALNTFRAYLFTPASIILIIMLLLIPLWCSHLLGDGTAEGKFKVFVTYSFFISSIILTAANISFSCSSISSEWKSRTLLLLDVKPIKRWEIIMGKWLGISLTNIVLILCFILSMAVSSFIVSNNLKTNFPEYRNIFKTEIELFPSSANQAFSTETPVSETSPETNYSTSSTAKETYAIPPRGSIKWTFRGIRKSKDTSSYLSYRFITSTEREKNILGYWILGNPSIEQTFELATSLTQDKIHRIQIPNDTISNGEELFLTYSNIEPSNISVLFPKAEFKILYPQGNYWVNLARGAVNVFLLVTFIYSVGIFFSCIVSNLTAVLATSILILISYMHDSIEIMVNSIFADFKTQQSVGIIQRLSYPVLKFITFILPPLNKALPHHYIGNFILLPFSYLISLFLRIIVFGALPLVIIAIIYLSRKELGIPNE